jgi:hypothetical protein
VIYFEKKCAFAIGDGTRDASGLQRIMEQSLDIGEELCVFFTD